MESEQVCEYPKCMEGKLLYRHVFFCEKSVCQFCNYPNCIRGTLRFRHRFLRKKTDSDSDTCGLCKSMMRLLKYHARAACTRSNCSVPRCSEIREKKLCKQRRLEWIEERVKRLQWVQPQPAAAAAAAAGALQLSLQLSLKKKEEKEKEEKKKKMKKKMRRREEEEEAKMPQE